jgi:hypothetical protein
LFVNQAAGDYHLMPWSPCVDSGTNDGAPLDDFDGRLRPADGNADGLAVTDMGAFESSPILVRIDILPGNPDNVIHLQPNRMITVAVLSDGQFDARNVDPTTVVFGPARALEAHGRGHWEDVNGDGLIDLMLHFRCGETGIKDGDTTVMLYGWLNTGEPIAGSDGIVAIGSKGKLK